LGQCNRCKGSGRIRTKVRSSWEIITGQPGTMTCPRCNGSGQFTGGGSSGSGSSWGSSNRSSSSRPPRENHRHTKSCRGSSCYNSIEYDDRWTNIPDYCKSCSSTWHEKQCGQDGCSNTIRYKNTFTNIATYCNYCTKKRAEGCTAGRCSDCRGILWIPQGKNYTRCSKCSEANKRTKACKGQGCHNQITYYVSDTKQYDYCRECSNKRVRVDRQGNTLQARAKDGTVLFTFGRCSAPRDDRHGGDADRRREWANRGCYWVAMVGHEHETFIISENPVIDGFIQQSRHIDTSYSTAALRDGWRAMAIAVLSSAY
jgi:LSD1 subclass zinc finger protein